MDLFIFNERVLMALKITKVFFRKVWFLYESIVNRGLVSFVKIFETNVWTIVFSLSIYDL